MTSTAPRPPRSALAVVGDRRLFGRLAARLNRPLLDLELPDGDAPLRLAAEVVRHTIPEQERLRGMGLRFVEPRDAQRRRLRRFVAEQAAAGS